MARLARHWIKERGIIYMCICIKSYDYIFMACLVQQWMTLRSKRAGLFGGWLIVALYSVVYYNTVSGRWFYKAFVTYLIYAYENVSQRYLKLYSMLSDRTLTIDVLRPPCTSQFFFGRQKIFTCQLVCGEFRQVCDRIVACHTISDSARSQNVLSGLVG